VKKQTYVKRVITKKLMRHKNCVVIAKKVATHHVLISQFSQIAKE
jgi:hypothetical protein